MFKLLIAFDGSTCAEQAIDDLQKAGLPRFCAAEVLTIADFWLPKPAAGESSSNTTVPPGIGKAYEHAAQSLAEAREWARRGEQRVREIFPLWDIQTRALDITPAWGIVERVSELKPDLVVVGSHGRNPLQMAVLGSVAQTVLTYAERSVRIARRGASALREPPRILLCYDGSTHADHALQSLVSRQWPAGTHVHVATASDAWHGTSSIAFLPGVAGWVREAHMLGRDQHTHLLEHATTIIKQAGIDCDSALLEGDARNMLLAEAERDRSDCIFMGARGLNAVERVLLGSVSGAISARARCSVEVVRAPAA